MTRLANVIMTCLSGLHEGSVLLKDLPNPPRPNRTYMSEKSFLKYVGNLTGPKPHGITWLLISLWRSYIIHYDQSGFSRPNHKGKMGEINNIYNVVNINESDKYI
jgi:hypothetical protein